METFKQWIQETFTPLVVVAATPAAEAICSSKNGLTFVDIIRPFSTVTRIDGQVRVGDEVVKMFDFRMRFHDLATIAQPQPEVLETHLHHVLSTSSAKYASMEPRSDLARAVHSLSGLPPGTLNDLAPWFSEYTREFLRLTGWGDHQTLDHPVAAILVAPAEVSNPLQYFETLLLHAQQPPLMQNEVMIPLKDREFPRYYVLLQDASNTAIDERKVNENLAALQKTFGAASACLLKINTGTGEKGSQGMPPEFFQRHMATCMPGGGAGEPASRPSAPPQGLGACLTAADLDSVAACVRHFTSQLLLPRLEERVAKLNMAVTATRKGLRNQFRRIFKGVVDESNTDRPYQWHSVESQLRQLGDLAFLLGAYTFANETYRLAGLDYLGHSNNRWYAGVEEMRALAVIMAPNDNDPQKYFARAFEHYTKLPNRVGRLLATRTVLMSARFQQAAGRYVAASNMLFKPHQEEENARAGVLLEQSAYCLLCTSPVNVRKYAFHMVLAALRYNGGTFKRLALHCYKQVLDVYQGKGWISIEQHLNALCAGLTMDAGDEVSAAKHFLALLQGPSGARLSSQNQAFQLKMFLDLTVRAGTKELEPGQHALVPPLSLPFINTKDIRVLFADTSSNANAAAAASPPNAWTPLEVACSGDVNVVRDTTSSALKQQNKEHEEYNLMAAGESVGVSVSLRNRLGVPLKAAQLRLVCEFTPMDEEQQPMAQPLAHAGRSWYQQRQQRDGDGDVGHSTDGASDGGGGGGSGGDAGLHPLAVGGHQTPGWQRSTSQYLHQEVVSLTLHPGESVTEVLSVTPLAAGWLRVTGVSWLLNNSVEGYQVFEPRGRKRKHPKGPRMTQQKHYPPWRRLLLRVVPSMCSLQLLHHALPAQLFTGEVRKVVLRIRNSGTLPCRNVQLAVSHPELVCTATITHPPGQEPAAPLPEAAGEAQALVCPLRLPVSQQVPGHCVYRPHAADLELAPGSCQDWTLWLHPRSVGTLLFNMVWYCEPVMPQGSVGGGIPGSFRFRTLRLTHSVAVSPVVVARAHVGPLASDLAAQLLRLQLDTPQTGMTVTISQITAATKGRVGGWRVSTELSRQSSLPQSSVAAQASAPADSTPDTRLSSGHDTLTPNITLTPGEPSNMQLILQPPLAATASKGEGAGSAGAEAAVLDCSGTVPAGLLRHWYVQGLSAVPALRSLGSEVALQAKASAVPAARAPGHSLHSDPQVDIGLLWRVQSGLGRTSNSQVQERVGVLMLSDLTLCTRPPPQPLRSRLKLATRTAPGCVVHDFRTSPMCMVDLVLGVRNCSGKSLQVDVQVGEDSSGGAAQHAWAMALSGPTAPAAGVPGTPTREGGPGLPGSVLSCQAGLQPGADYMWCGRTRVGIAQLEPGVSVEVPLRVAFFKPGTYAVTGCKLVFNAPSGVQKVSLTTEALTVRVEMV